MSNHQKSSEKGGSKHKILISFFSGGFAGICSKTMIAPIERVKFLFITSNRKFSYKEYITDFLYIVRKNGILNLWRGNTVNVIRIFPHAAIDFAVFDFLRSKFYGNQHGKSKIVLFFCGAMAGITALTFTTPLEFLRVRMSMERDNFSYSGNLEATKRIYDLQGWRGFYRGYKASVAGIFIYHGFSFFIFTKLKEQIKIYHPQLYKKWYVDFALGAVSAIGQLMAYPFDVLRKRMQGQHLLLQKKLLTHEHNYKQLFETIVKNQGFFNGLYKGLSLNIIKAPIGSATVWTIKNYLNRKLDPSYDL